MDSIEQLNQNIHPVLGPNFSEDDYMELDLSISNDEIRTLDVVKGLQGYINSKLGLAGKAIAIGGYGEERDFYWSSPLFKSEQEKRTIHLGLDLWTNPMQSIYAPVDGVVHSMKYNNLPLDYGYTVLLKHSVGDLTFYALYGHLSDKGMEKLEVGQLIAQGEIFAYIGHPDTNGGWAPHLHLQIIKDLEGNFGDYPGVCTKEKMEFYLSNCPNPERIIFNKG